MVASEDDNFVDFVRNELQAVLNQLLHSIGFENKNKGEIFFDEIQNGFEVESVKKS